MYEIWSKPDSVNKTQKEMYEILGKPKSRRLRQTCRKSRRDFTNTFIKHTFPTRHIPLIHNVATSLFRRRAKLLVRQATIGSAAKHFVRGQAHQSGFPAMGDTRAIEIKHEKIVIVLFENGVVRDSVQHFLQGQGRRHGMRQGVTGQLPRIPKRTG